jgi:hypothetical protein
MRKQLYARNPFVVLGILAGAVFLIAVTAGPRSESPPPVSKESPACLADISYPIQVNVVPQGPVRPGATVSARIEVTADRFLDEVSIRVTPPAGVRLLSTPAWNLGLMRAGEARARTLQVVVPADGARRTVDILVEASRDGFRLTRGAVLNLVSEEEPAREVETPDGRRVREVVARRIG